MKLFTSEEERRGLERARHLALAADEPAAKDLLLSLMPEIEQADRDDLMLEVLAQLGELYLVRTAYDGVREGATRIRDCLSNYSSILDGTATQEIVAKSTVSDADARHLIRRYSRRAQRSGIMASRKTLTLAGLLLLNGCLYHAQERANEGVCALAAMIIRVLLMLTSWSKRVQGAPRSALR